jgi:hypothetical protein
MEEETIALRKKQEQKRKPLSIYEVVVYLGGFLDFINTQGRNYGKNFSTMCIHYQTDSSLITNRSHDTGRQEDRLCVK